jgi:hypothetical protein
MTPWTKIYADRERRGALAVYVPAPGHSLPMFGVAPRSGIVGAVDAEPVTGMIVIDYEGDLYHAANIRGWADRVFQAEGRHRVQYPTVARRAVPPDALVRVGTVHDESMRIIPRLWVENRQALADYLGLDVESEDFNDQLLRQR